MAGNYFMYNCANSAFNFLFLVREAGSSSLFQKLDPEPLVELFVYHLHSIDVHFHLINH